MFLVGLILTLIVFAPAEVFGCAKAFEVALPDEPRMAWIAGEHSSHMNTPGQHRFNNTPEFVMPVTFIEDHEGSKVQIMPAKSATPKGSTDSRPSE